MCKVIGLFFVFLFVTAYGVDFLYCLQPQGRRQDFPERAAAVGRSHIVTDVSFDGSEEMRWTAEEVRRFRRGGGTVLCYFSIGEAEDYRGYWLKSWKKCPPRFLLKENSEWKGNYRVRYWDPEWQGIILRELERIVAVGFDGVYLDIVDGYEFFEGFGKRDFCINPETGRSYRADMVQWVLRIAEHARRINPRFQIFMQNGEALLADAGLRRAINGVSMESLFFHGNTPKKKKEMQERIQNIQGVLADGKICFAVEYCSNARQKQLREMVRSTGIPALMTNKELTIWGTWVGKQ